MRRSLVLWLHLLSWPRAARTEFVEALPRVHRPDGTIIWLHVPEGGAQSAAALIAKRLRKLRPTLGIVVSVAPGAVEGNGFPSGITITQAPRTRAEIVSFLRHWKPDLGVMLGTGADPALIVDAQTAGVPLMLANARLSEPRAGQWLRRGMIRALLAPYRQILTEDHPSAAALIRLGAPRERVEVSGQLGEPPEPLRCSEAERASLAALMQARPCWFATSVPPQELDAVLEAHGAALRLAHRMLLILAPDNATDTTQLAERLRQEGWEVAQRSCEGEPDEDVEVFLVDDAAEYGLWYRLAPVCFMGGTLTGTALAPRAPEEAAALGSAIVHGPVTAPYAGQYARLSEARAARAIQDAAGLGDALAELIAPDRVAALAHNAWAVTSGGAGVAEAVARTILAQLDKVQGVVPLPKAV